jgi:hypothetical protein
MKPCVPLSWPETVGWEGLCSSVLVGVQSRTWLGHTIHEDTSPFKPHKSVGASHL